MSCAIVRYAPEFKRDIAELQKHSWSPSESLNMAYFEWKYERNPYNPDPCLFLALDSGRVVGMRGMYGAKWEIGGSGESFRTLCASDLVIAPEYRNKGLVSRIMQVGLKELAGSGEEYVFNLSASPITFVNSLAGGWRSIGSSGALRRTTRLSTVARSAGRAARKLPIGWRYADSITELCAGLGRHKRWFDRSIVPGKVRISPFISVESTPRSHAMAELVSRLGPDGRIRHVRDTQYFDWRFQNPLSSYRFLFWEDARLEGYLVLELPSSGFATRLRANIVDWEGTSFQVRSDLLRAVVGVLGAPEMEVWSATLPEETKCLLHDNAFYPLNEPGRMTRYRPCVLVRPVRDPHPKTDWVYFNRRLLDLTSWDLRLLHAL